MQALRVSGEIAKVIVTFDFTDPQQIPRLDTSAGSARAEPLDEKGVVGLLEGDRHKIQRRIANDLRTDLGSTVDADDFLIVRGSIELIVVATTVLTAIKDYNDYIDAIAKTAARLRKTLQTVMGWYVGDGCYEVAATGNPGSALLEAHERAQERADSTRSAQQPSDQRLRRREERGEPTLLIMLGLIFTALVAILGVLLVIALR